MVDLIEASKNGNLVQIRQLVLEEGSDVNFLCPPDGTTALYWAACNGHVAACDWLINHGADVNLAVVKSGSIPLHAAADRGHSSCVFLLMRRGSLIDMKTTSNGDTALHLAAYRGHVNICRLLLGHGACASMSNKQGRTPLEEATTKGHSETFHLIHQHQHGLGQPRDNISTSEVLRHATGSSGEHLHNITSPLISAPILYNASRIADDWLEYSSQSKNKLNGNEKEIMMSTKDKGRFNFQGLSFDSSFPHKFTGSETNIFSAVAGFADDFPRHRRISASGFDLATGLNLKPLDLSVKNLTKKISMLEEYAQNLQLELTKRDDKLNVLMKENLALKAELNLLRGRGTDYE